MSFFTAGRKREGGGTDFVSKLAHASIASHYDYDVLGSLCANVQQKCSDLIILKFKTEKSMFKLRLRYFPWYDLLYPEMGASSIN
jgi:hypothetical protein